MAEAVKEGAAHKSCFCGEFFVDFGLFFEEFFAALRELVAFESVFVGEFLDVLVVLEPGEEGVDGAWLGFQSPPVCFWSWSMSSLPDHGFVV